MTSVRIQQRFSTNPAVLSLTVYLQNKTLNNVLLLNMVCQRSTGNQNRRINVIISNSPEENKCLTVQQKTQHDLKILSGLMPGFVYVSDILCRRISGFILEVLALQLSAALYFELCSHHLRSWSWLRLGRLGGVDGAPAIVKKK